ncbi:MAG: zinc-dependent peptidase, partial [Flavobacteriales bacterium]|nr:zinc-dependent peptidase [Flavobacteriales bacterium]
KRTCDVILSESNDYYKDLSPEMREIFVLRLLYFLKHINFSSSNQICLTFEIKTLVASGFVQLTFGLKRYRLRNFETIHIAHKPYAYKDIGLLYHGDTNPKMARINLVWKVVEEGFKIPDDSLNLSIHEFSHALILDNKERMTFRKFYRHKDLIYYLLAAKLEMHRIRKGNDSLFRSYGATNLMEFFAVSVEVFFEQSKRFASDYPILFERLCFLLKQDPRQRNNPRI